MVIIAQPTLSHVCPGVYFYISKMISQHAIEVEF